MRVAHLNTAKSWRGGEQQLLLLMRGLAAQAEVGVEQVLYAQPDSPLASRAEAAGFPVVPLAVRSSGDVLASRRLRKALAADPVDVLHLHTAHAHSVGVRGARFLGASRPAVVVTRHVSYSIYRHFPWHLTWFKYTKGIAKIICVAEAVRDALRKNRLPDDLLAVVHNGVDPDAWQADASARARIRDRLEVPGPAPLVGTVGALTREKDQQALLEAFALLEPARSGARLAIVGEGPLKGELVHAAAKLGIAGYTHIVGFQEDVADWLAAFDLFVFPSRKEGLPMIVLEAMAAGRPVLATTAGGIPELVRDGQDGVLVPPGDGAALAAALADLLDDAPRRRALSESARARACEAFDYHTTAARVLAVYREAVS
ncbi:MAG: glycosyltransferase [Planctomycetota bacterium]|nr:glycosyltransferase [Planctomycetota bacterium]